MAQKYGNAWITEVHFCIYVFYIYSCDSLKITENIFFLSLSIPAVSKCCHSVEVSGQTPLVVLCL